MALLPRTPHLRAVLMRRHNIVCAAKGDEWHAKILDDSGRVFVGVTFNNAVDRALDVLGAPRAERPLQMDLPLPIPVTREDIAIGAQRVAEEETARLRSHLDTLIYQIDPEDTPFLKGTPAPDMVNHPPHYTSGRIECIDALRACLGDDHFVSHCKATAMKYLWRAGKKGEPVQCMEKAIWYIQKAIDTLNDPENDT